MESLVQPYRLRTRIVMWAEEVFRLGNLPPKSGNILEAVLYRGELPRGDAAGVVGTGDRQARRIVSALIEKGVLVSDSARAAASRLLGNACLTLDAGIVSRQDQSWLSKKISDFRRRKRDIFDREVVVSFPYPHRHRCHLAMDFPLARSATGLPCSAEMTRSVRSALYAGSVDYP